MATHQRDESTLQSFRVTPLSKRYSARFLEMLDANAEPTAALAQAAWRHKPRRAKVFAATNEGVMNDG